MTCWIVGRTFFSLKIELVRNAWAPPSRAIVNAKNSICSRFNCFALFFDATPGLDSVALRVAGALAVGNGDNCAFSGRFSLIPCSPLPVPLLVATGEWASGDSVPPRPDKARYTAAPKATKTIVYIAVRFFISIRGAYPPEEKASCKFNKSMPPQQPVGKYTKKRPASAGRFCILASRSTQSSLRTCSIFWTFATGRRPTARFTRFMPCSGFSR